MPDYRHPREHARDLLEPIVHVFEGHDDGVAYAKFRHSILPSLIISAIQDGEGHAVQTLDTVARFSLICRTLLSLSPTGPEKASEEA